MTEPSQPNLASLRVRLERLLDGETEPVVAEAPLGLDPVELQRRLDKMEEIFRHPRRPEFRFELLDPADLESRADETTRRLVSRARHLALERGDPCTGTLHLLRALWEEKDPPEADLPEPPDFEAPTAEEEDHSSGFSREAVWALNIAYWESRAMSLEAGVLEPHNLKAGLAFSGGAAGRLPGWARTRARAAYSLPWAFETGHLDQLQALIQVEPDQVYPRLMLLTLTGNLQDRRREHLDLALWLVRRHPDLFTVLRSSPVPTWDEETRAEGIRAWLAHLEGDSAPPEVLGGLAAAFLPDFPTAEMALRCAARAEPGNPEWWYRLAQLYSAHAEVRGGTDRTLDEAALAALEQALDLDPEASAFEVGGAAALAAKLGRLDLTEAYTGRVIRLLEEAGPEADAAGELHRKRVEMGLFALRRGEPGEACRWLAEAAREDALAFLAHPARELEVALAHHLDLPWVGGPDMRLARRLVEEGHREVVLGWLERIRPAWPQGGDRATEWIAALRRGEDPDFGDWAAE